MPIGSKFEEVFSLKYCQGVLWSITSRVRPQLITVWHADHLHVIVRQRCLEKHFYKRKLDCRVYV